MSATMMFAPEAAMEFEAESEVDREKERREDLLEIVRRRCGKIPGEWLLPALLRACEGGDADMRKEAVEALSRRYANARREELRIASRPAGGAVVGNYRTRRKGESERGYRTELYSVVPLRGSCSCRDFARSSLGVCKHLLVVLEHLASRPRLRKKAENATELERAKPLLEWDPYRPLGGAEDRLARMKFRPGPRARVGHGLLAGFTPVKASPGETGDNYFAPQARILADPKRRLQLVQRLRQATRRVRGRLAIDAALEHLLEDEKNSLKRRLAMLGTLKTRSFTQRGARLYPYQKKGVRRFLENGRLLLADDMGLGKTAQAIAVCHTLWNHKLVRRGLILVPSPLKGQWSREWANFSDTPVQIVAGNRLVRRAIYEETRSGFLIANYEQVLRDLDAIQSWSPELLVLDEAQRIKNWATKTALSVKRIDAPYRLALTGTPLENRIAELASIFDLVDDHALEPKWRLAPWHGIRDLDDEGRSRVVGVRNLDSLRARIAPFMERRLRAEVLTELPERNDTQIHVPMTAVQQDEHDALAPMIRQIAARAQRRPLTQAEFLRLMQLLQAQRVLANGIGQAYFKETWPEIRELEPTRRRIENLYSPKLFELRELLQSLCVDQGRKVVVFSAFRRMLDLASWSLGTFLREHDLRGAFFTGQESNARREASIEAFLDDPDTRILFASDAGSVGLNLQKSANACIHLDIPWNPAVLEQRNGRIYRLGQKSKVDFYYLISERSIEERMAQVLSDKKALFEGLFDGTTDTVLFEESASFLGRIQEMFEDESSAPATVSVETAETEEEPEEFSAPPEPLLEATDESQDVPATPVMATSPAVPIQSLFAGLKIEKRKDGSMRIDAAPEAAEGLARLFESLAAALRS